MGLFGLKIVSGTPCTVVRCKYGTDGVPSFNVTVSTSHYVSYSNERIERSKVESGIGSLELGMHFCLLCERKSVKTFHVIPIHPL